MITNQPSTSDQPADVKDKPGMYLIPALREAVNPVPFASAVTEVDPHAYPMCKCGNWDVDCVCSTEGR